MMKLRVWLDATLEVSRCGTQVDGLPDGTGPRVDNHCATQNDHIIVAIVYFFEHVSMF